MAIRLLLLLAICMVSAEATPTLEQQQHSWSSTGNFEPEVSSVELEKWLTHFKTGNNHTAGHKDLEVRACPPGFTIVSGRCYAFSQDLGVTAKTHAEAKVFCKILSGTDGHVDLGTFGHHPSISEDPILEYIWANGKASAGLWLGVERYGTYLYRFNDGRGLSSNSFFWHYAEPDNEGCVLAHSGWANNALERTFIADTGCTSKYNFMCQSF